MNQSITWVICRTIETGEVRGQTVGSDMFQLTKSNVMAGIPVISTGGISPSFEYNTLKPITPELGTVTGGPLSPITATIWLGCPAQSYVGVASLTMRLRRIGNESIPQFTSAKLQPEMLKSLLCQLGRVDRLSVHRFPPEVPLTSRVNVSTTVLTP